MMLAHVQQTLAMMEEGKMKDSQYNVKGKGRFQGL